MAAAPDPDWTACVPPTADDIAGLARASVEALPETVRGRAREVAVRVEEVAPDILLDEMKIDDPYALTGLYEGVPLTEKSVMDQPLGADTIRLFRRPLLEEWVEREEVSLGALVGHVMVHELAHHFGWSDADIARIDRWWE